MSIRADGGSPRPRRRDAAGPGLPVRARSRRFAWETTSVCPPARPSAAAARAVLLATVRSSATLTSTWKAPASGSFMTEGSVEVRVEWSVLPPQVDAVGTVLHALLSATRARAGLSHVYARHRHGDAVTLRLGRSWDSEDALRRHLRSPRFEALAGLLESAITQPRVEFVLPTGTRGLEYARGVRDAIGGHPMNMAARPCRPGRRQSATVGRGRSPSRHALLRPIAAQPQVAQTAARTLDDVRRRLRAEHDARWRRGALAEVTRQRDAAARGGRAAAAAGASAAVASGPQAGTGGGVAVGGRPECRDPARARTGRPGGPHQRHGAADRRNRHRQGALRDADPRGQPARAAADGPRELLGHPDRAHRERAVRAGEGRLHRRAVQADRPVRGRQRVDAVPRRGGRPAARRAGEAAARAAGAHHRTPRQPAADRRRRADHRRDQSRPGRGGARRDVPERSRTTGSTSSRSRCRRCGNGARTSRLLVEEIVEEIGEAMGKRFDAVAQAQPRGPAARATGPGTCGNCATSWSAP